MRPSLLILAAGVALAGCEPRPSAPALRDDPVYQNDREGFRFLAPDGWTQSLRGEARPGKAEVERTLVAYRPAGGDAAASLRVSLIDLPPSSDLAALLAGPSHSADKWTPTAPPEDVKVGGVAGVRYAFTGRVGKGAMTKEVVAVRRGERVYLFTALSPPKEAEVREQLRQVVGSVIWK